MKCQQTIVVLLGLIVQVLCTRITLDEDAQTLCKKYKMMCKTGKICAVQHFDWPKQITIPVCIPLSFVPAEFKHHVRNLICQLPPLQGRCSARYIRWYYNVHSQECNHFQYGGCQGNQNNFMTKTDCENSCLATPSLTLLEGGQSSLVDMKPAIMTAPIYEPNKVNKYEALNSVMTTGNDPLTYDRYQLVRHRPNKMRNDESNTRKRRRLDKERAKERKRRERRKEKKRLRKLRLKKRNKKDKKGKKRRDGKKRKIKEEKKEDEIEIIRTTDVETEAVNSIDTPVDVIEETKNMISNTIEEVEEDEEIKKEKRKERKRKKRREKLRRKRRLERELGKDNKNKKSKKSNTVRRFAELVKKPAEDAYIYNRFSSSGNRRYSPKIRS